MTDPVRPGLRPDPIPARSVPSLANIEEQSARLFQSRPDMRTAEAASDTAQSARDTATTSRSTAEAVAALVQAGIDAQEREVKMLFWTRVAGIGALVSIAIGLLALVVAIG